MKTAATLKKAGTRSDLAYWVLGSLLLLGGILFRVHVYPIATSDYSAYFMNWFQALQSPGLSAFANPFSNYTPLYLYFIKLATLFPVYSLYIIKTLSLIFDLIAAALSCLILKELQPEKFTMPRLFFAFVTILATPTVMINSSLWAQCDSWYASGVLAALYFIIRDRPLSAIVAFSFAFCLKLQAIFFAPVLVGYLLSKGRATWSLALVPILFALSILPVKLGGGALRYWGPVYLFQTKMFSALNMSSASIYSFATSVDGTEARLVSAAGIVAAGTIALAIAASFYSFRKPKKIQPRMLLLLSLGSVLCIPYVLPHMHERYFYLADILSVIFALYDPRRWYVPVLVVSASFFSYMIYLSAFVPFFGRLIVDLRIPSAMLLVALLIVFNLIVSERRADTLSRSTTD